MPMPNIKTAYYIDSSHNLHEVITINGGRGYTLFLNSEGEWELAPVHYPAFDTPEQAVYHACTLSYNAHLRAVNKLQALVVGAEPND